MNEQWDAWMENEKKEESRSRSIVLDNKNLNPKPGEDDGWFLSNVIQREVSCKRCVKDWKDDGTMRYELPASNLHKHEQEKR